MKFYCLAEFVEMANKISFGKLLQTADLLRKIDF